MNAWRGCSLFAAWLAIVACSRGAEPAKKPMPIYVTPFYNSEGLKIDVGKHSETLAQANAKTILQFCDNLKKEKDNLRAEVMYVTAVRLYDLGHKDEAVYWYYTAQYRGRLFSSLLEPEKIGSIGNEPFELRAAYGSFNQLSGEYINGYGFGDLKKLEKTLNKVAEEAKTVPKFKEIYPRVEFVPENQWEEKNKEMLAGLSGLNAYIKDNADKIKEQRKKNGIEGKY